MRSCQGFDELFKQVSRPHLCNNLTQEHAYIRRLSAQMVAHHHCHRHCCHFLKSARPHLLRIPSHPLSSMSACFQHPSGIFPHHPQLAQLQLALLLQTPRMPLTHQQLLPPLVALLRILLVTVMRRSGQEIIMSARLPPASVMPRPPSVGLAINVLPPLFSMNISLSLNSILLPFLTTKIGRAHV